ncbi:MAG: hypothetical protein NTX44_09925 [Ignavibacteriales bacterium]|nr:hypothetical protein [Ignavibacteriales bacterium]
MTAIEIPFSIALVFNPFQDLYFDFFFGVLFFGLEPTTHIP